MKASNRLFFGAYGYVFWSTVFLLLAGGAKANRGRPSNQNNYSNHRQIFEVPRAVLMEYNPKHGNGGGGGAYEYKRPTERATIGDLAELLERHGVVNRDTGKTPSEWATLLLTRPLEAEKVFLKHEHLFTTSGQKLMKKTINALIESLDPIEQLRRNQESLFSDIKKVQSAIRSWGFTKRSEGALDEDFKTIANAFPVLGSTPATLFISEGRDYFYRSAATRGFTPLETSVIDLLATEFEKVSVSHVQRMLKKPTVTGYERKVSHALNHLFGIYLKQVDGFQGPGRAHHIDTTVDAFLSNPAETIERLEKVGAISPTHTQALAGLASDLQAIKN